MWFQSLTWDNPACSMVSRPAHNRYMFHLDRHCNRRISDKPHAILSPEQLAGCTGPVSVLRNRHNMTSAASLKIKNIRQVRNIYQNTHWNKNVKSDPWEENAGLSRCRSSLHAKSVAMGKVFTKMNHKSKICIWWTIWKKRQ